MKPFLPHMLGTLATLFDQSLMQSNYLMLEATLQTIGSIASTNEFSEFYPTFMPGMVKIVTSIPSDTQQKLSIKSKAI